MVGLCIDQVCLIMMLGVACAFEGSIGITHEYRGFKKGSDGRNARSTKSNGSFESKRIISLYWII